MPPARSRPSHRPGTIERAFQLARSGSCRSIGDIERQLVAEDFENVWDHLAGQLTKSQLREAMRKAHRMQAPGSRGDPSAVCARASVPPAGASRG